MNYTIIIFKRPGVAPHPREPLFAIWIDEQGAEPKPSTVWEAIQRIEVVVEQPIPKALCGLRLMSESTSNRLFRDVVDTWLGPVKDDLLNDYDRYASQEDSKTVLDRDYLDRLEDT
jgi:hypothetical protein